MRNTIHTDKKYSIILFLIWPFLALTYAIRNYRAAWAKNIIWLFVIFYGLTLTLQNTNGDEESIDAYRYRIKLVEMAAQPITIENFSSLLYTGDANSQTLDVIETAVIVLLSRVTENYHVLFAVFGLIFGYFYSRNIWYLIEKAGLKITSANVPVIITFAMVVGFWEINGFRFWSATHIFLYGTLPFLYEGKKKRLLFSVLAIFMHFAYMLPLLILGIYLLVGRRTNIFFVLFIVTFFIRQLDLGSVSNFLSGNLPEIFLPKVKNYTSEEYAQTIDEKNLTANWYAVFYRDILKWAITAFLVVIFFRGRQFIKRYKGFENLFSFTLLLFSAANIFSLVPSGGRYLILSSLFAMALIFIYIQFAPRDKAIKNLILVALPAFAIYSIVSLRIAFETMGFFSVFGNPIMNIFLDADFTLIELIKSVL